MHGEMPRLFPALPTCLPLSCAACLFWQVAPTCMLCSGSAQIAALDAIAWTLWHAPNNHATCEPCWPWQRLAWLTIMYALSPLWSSVANSTVDNAHGVAPHSQPPPLGGRASVEVVGSESVKTAPRCARCAQGRPVSARQGTHGVLPATRAAPTPLLHKGFWFSSLLLGRHLGLALAHGHLVQRLVRRGRKDLVRSLLACW